MLDGLVEPTVGLVEATLAEVDDRLDKFNLLLHTRIRPLRLQEDLPGFRQGLVRLFELPGQSEGIAQPSPRQGECFPEPFPEKPPASFHGGQGSPRPVDAVRPVAPACLEALSAQEIEQGRRLESALGAEDFELALRRLVPEAVPDDPGLGLSVDVAAKDQGRRGRPGLVVRQGETALEISGETPHLVGRQDAYGGAPADPDGAHLRLRLGFASGSRRVAEVQGGRALPLFEVPVEIVRGRVAEGFLRDDADRQLGFRDQPLGHGALQADEVLVEAEAGFFAEAPADPAVDRDLSLDVPDVQQRVGEVVEDVVEDRDETRVFRE